MTLKEVFALELRQWSDRSLRNRACSSLFPEFPPPKKEYANTWREKWIRWKPPLIEIPANYIIHGVESGRYENPDAE